MAHALATITTPQDVEGITPRSVVAQTVHIRSRADWYAFTSACRKVARDRVEQRKAGLHGFWANVSGRVYRCKVERNSFGVERRGAGFHKVCHGAPVRLELARIADRPIGQRHGDEMAWAARYRANAMRDVRNAHHKALSIRGAKACLRDARALRLDGAGANVFDA